MVTLHSFREADGSVRRSAFGHAGVGGSIALCDPAKDFAVAITVNKLTVEREASRRLLNLICKELNLGYLTTVE